MKFPNWFRISWWALLLSLVSFYLYFRLQSMWMGSSNGMDVVVFLVWIVLLLAPLFQEVNVFGLRFKQQVDALTAHIDNQMLTLRSEIRNSVDVQSQISPQFTIMLHPITKSPQSKAGFARSLKIS